MEEYVGRLTYARKYDNLLVVETLSMGKAGWVRYEADDCPPTFLRFLPNERGRLLLRECFIDSSEGQPISREVLGRIPLTNIEALVNGDTQIFEYLNVGAEVRSPVGGPAGGSNLSVLASHYATTFGKEQPANWCALAQQGSPVSKKPRRKRDLRALEDDFRLNSPPGTEGLTDEFLGRVARAYLAAISRGENPNKTIHKDVGFNPTKSPRTVERWVAQARDRKILAAARPGARG